MNSLQILFQHDAIRVEIDLEQNFLQATWLKQPESSEFRRHILEITDFAIEHNIRKSLFDVRKRGYMEFSDQNWSLKEIFPRLQGKLTKLAYLTKVESLHMMDTLRLKESVADASVQLDKVQIEVFLELEDAMDWVLN